MNEPIIFNINCLNLNMETVIAHPDNKEQLAALKAVMVALKISFEEQKTGYDPEFVAKILKSKKQVENSETRVVNIADL